MKARAKIILFVAPLVMGVASPFQTGSLGRGMRSILSATIPTEGKSATDLSGVSQAVEPDMKAYASGYKTVFEEVPFAQCSPLSGKIPDDLRGSYYRAGPAMFSAGSIVPPNTSIVQPRQPPVPNGHDADRMVRHPFEGDGAVLGITFPGNGRDPSVRYRYVRTVAFTNERKRGQRTYKAMDPTRALGAAALGGVGNDLPLPALRHHLQPGRNKNRKNTSNTRTIYWGKRLLTLWEGGLPYKMDSLALSTEGSSRLGGAIERETDPFGGKMVLDSKKDRALFYGINQGSTKSELTVYEFDAGFRLVPGGRNTVQLPGFALINDFCATENYAVFVQPDMKVDKMQFMVSKDPGKTVSPGDGPAVVHLIPRAGSSSRPQISVQVPVDAWSDTNLQFCNAYEEGDQVIFDVIRSDPSSLTGSKPLTWPWGTSLAEYRSAASKKSLWRYTVDTKRKSASKKQLFDDHCMFGVVNPAVSTSRHRFIYAAVGGMGSEVAPPQGLARFDCETLQADKWMPESYEFCGEPMYAPKQGKSDAEDAGYILSVLYNGGKTRQSELIILEASNLSAGPMARIPLGMAVPHGFFGCFTDSEEATWSDEELQRRAKLADKIESKGSIWNEVRSDFSGLGLRFDEIKETFPELFS
jgi:all-trans-8'-apo-beta-carotenal 15,15'-oxygenase